MKTLHVGWLEDDTYQDGGCYALYCLNGHLWAELCIKGRSEAAHINALEVCIAFNTRGEPPYMEDAS